MSEEEALWLPVDTAQYISEPTGPPQPCLSYYDVKADEWEEYAEPFHEGPTTTVSAIIFVFVALVLIYFHATRKSLKSTAVQ